MTSRDLPQHQPDVAGELRARAEAALGKDRAPRDPATLMPEASLALLHELEVHQIELEMQNEELRQAQLELEVSHARYFDLYDLAPVGYCTISDSGMILEANLCASKLLDTPRTKLAGKAFNRFILAKDQDIFFLMNKRLRQDGGAAACELRMLGHAGTPFWAQLAVSLASDEHGTALLHLAMSDISAQKNVAAQLLETQTAQVLGSLAGGIARNFNNLLNVIIGNNQRAIEDSGSNQSALISLHEIGKSAARARDLVQAIESLGRRQPADKKRITLGPLVEEAVRLLHAALPPRITILVHPAAMLPEIIADAQQLQQVILSLATNSIQALADTTGRIEIRQDTVVIDDLLAATDAQLGTMYRKHPGRAVRLILADNGPGMEAATLARAFEPFFSTRPAHVGAGLGLAVAQSIMQAHEGAICIDSAPGRGTRVSLYLPLAGAGTAAR